MHCPLCSLKFTNAKSSTVYMRRISEKIQYFRWCFLKIARFGAHNDMAEFRILYH
jgi:hypothetical protein